MVFMPQLAIPALPAITALKELTPSKLPVLQDPIAKKVLTNKLVRLGTIARQVLHHSKHVLQVASTPIVVPLLLVLVKHVLVAIFAMQVRTTTK